MPACGPRSASIGFGSLIRVCLAMIQFGMSQFEEVQLETELAACTHTSKQHLRALASLALPP